RPPIRGSERESTATGATRTHRGAAGRAGRAGVVSKRVGHIDSRIDRSIEPCSALASLATRPASGRERTLTFFPQILAFTFVSGMIHQGRQAKPGGTTHLISNRATLAQGR